MIEMEQIPLTPLAEHLGKLIMERGGYLPKGGDEKWLEMRAGEIRKLVREEKKHLWHDANKEQPNLGSSVLISKDWKHFEVMHSVLNVYEDRFWCYLEDLFPTIEEERK